MGDTIRFAIIGLGTMGRLYALLAEQNPKVTLVAICDRDAQSLEEAGEEHAGAAKYADYERMLKEVDLEAIGIMTPDFAHCAPAIAAAQAGCHLLIEKPMAMDVGEAHRIVAAVRESRVRCQVAYTNRWTPPYVAARNLISSGQLGEVTSLNARINNTLITPTQMLRWVTRSSPGWFLMTHALDIGRWLSDTEPVQTYAHGVKKVLISKGIDAYDTIQALFQLASGGTLFIESSWILPRGMPLIFDFKYEIIGTEAVMTVDTHDQGIHLVTEEKLTHPVSLFLQRYGTYVGHSQAMFDSFIDSVVMDEKPLVNEEDGLRATAAIAAVHESLRTGTSVAIQVDL
jgi:predicted dehydrogenase